MTLTLHCIFFTHSVQSFCRKKRISLTIYMYHMHEMLLIFIIQNKCSLIIINARYGKKLTTYKR